MKAFFCDSCGEAKPYMMPAAELLVRIGSDGVRLKSKYDLKMDVCNTCVWSIIEELFKGAWITEQQRIIDTTVDE